jgi:hypothetical protein
LAAVLVAAVASFAVMGWLQRRRAGRLSRVAHRAGLRFTRDDPFDVPRRYADFVLIGCGHSAQANNVTYGRLDGLPVRMFDFRFEVGHGTHRSTRTYGVVVVEVEKPCQPVLMWNERDSLNMPLEAMQFDGRIDGWCFRGDPGTARVLGSVAGDLAEKGLSVQTLGAVILMWRPAVGAIRDYSDDLEAARAVARALTRPAGESRGENPVQSRHQSIENGVSPC